MPPETVTIATYNIQKGSNARQILQNISYLAERGVNVFCLQEVHQRDQEPFIAHDISRVLGHHWIPAYFLTQSASNNDLGLATFCDERQFELGNVTGIYLPKREGRSLDERVTSSEKEVTQRGALSVMLKMRDKLLKITNAHLDWRGGLSHRMKQFACLSQFLHSTRNTAHEVLCGDLNTIISWKSQVRQMIAALGEEFSYLCNNVPWTYDLANPDPGHPLHMLQRLCKWAGIGYPERLDHFFARGMQTEEMLLFETDGSDHYPLISKLRFVV